jgi:hypothetical protein
MFYVENKIIEGSPCQSKASFCPLWRTDRRLPPRCARQDFPLRQENGEFAEFRSIGGSFPLADPKNGTMVLLSHYVPSSKT